MEKRDKQKNWECLPKLPTGIRGLDKVLYGGIDANFLNPCGVDAEEIPRNPLVIVIRGSEDDNDKCMLAMQMLYGITQSIEKIKPEYGSFRKDWNNEPIMYSTYYNKYKMDDLFLDFFISSSLQEILRKKASKDTTVNFSSNVFTNLLFDNTQILCKNVPTPTMSIPYKSIENEVDAMMGDGIVYYNRRTNSLHVKASLTADDNKYNQVYRRKKNSVNAYSELYYNEQEDALFYSYAGLHFLPFEMVNKNNYWELANSIDASRHLVAVDVSDAKMLDRNAIGKILDGLRCSKIAVLCADSSSEIPENRVNIIIDLSQKLDHKFVLKYLQIIKSDSQEFFPGQHQYKKRDFGIEVYPRKELYIHERRYLQRALVYTHLDAVTESYRQYMCQQKYYQGDNSVSYDDYKEELKKNKPFFSLYPQNYMQQMSIDLLNKILIPVNPLRQQNKKSKEKDDLMAEEYMYGNAGFVTAVVGKANTYKRFLTFGGIFGSACSKDHTLIVMMNKEESVTRRRLICPAKPWKVDKMDYCRECYGYIHFMNICMGNITPEEFLYYLEKQIEVPYDYESKKRIRRIVIDDLQILDFCFPRLEKNGLFLAALAELCRVHDIILYFLCDTASELLPTLRALADNVIFTKKDEDGHPLIFVEKFAGYTNTPSKMYCGKVKSVNKLFRCVENYDSNGFCKFEFQSNIVELEDMDEQTFYDLD